MVHIQYSTLAILVVYFAQDVNTIADEQFEELRDIVDDLKIENKELKNENKALMFMITNLRNRVDHQDRTIDWIQAYFRSQLTNITIDARITALEGICGKGSNESETVAFYAVIPSPVTIEEGATVIFADVLTNSGDGYNSSTGVFTVPSGGDGLYYFSIYLLIEAAEVAYFNIVVNDVIVCTAWGDQSAGLDNPQATCSAVVYVTEGDEIQVIYDDGVDSTPLGWGSISLLNGFNGFKI